MDKKIQKFEIIGAIFSIFVGSLLHFVYKWSGNHPLVAIIAAVNESTWEHLKLGFWPLLFWGILEYFVFGKQIKNFFFATFASLLIFCLSVPALFYSYVAILGKNYLFIDISTFIVSIALGQYIGYRIMKNKKNFHLEKISIILILFLIISFSSFSFFTPRNFLFKDPITKKYGINDARGNQINRRSCLADECLAVQDLTYPAGKLPEEVKKALDEAVNDEYKALSTYQAIVAKFGSVRPFSMIKGAEEQHIAMLTSIYDKYGVEIPKNTWGSNVSVPVSLQQACQVGVDAEIANAALYKEKLLPVVRSYEDITLVFTNLMNASQKRHLPAFDRCN